LQQAHSAHYAYRSCHIAAFVDATEYWTGCGRGIELPLLPWVRAKVAWQQYSLVEIAHKLTNDNNRKIDITKFIVTWEIFTEVFPKISRKIAVNFSIVQEKRTSETGNVL